MRTLATVAALLVISSSSALAARLPSAPKRLFVPGELVVVTETGALEAPVGGALRARSAALEAALARFGLARAERIGGAGAGAIWRMRSERDDFDPRAAAAALRAQPGVLGAAPNLNLRLDLVPNDPAWPTQWHLGNSAAAIHAPAGWNRSTGSPSVPIAIIDTGVDTGHEDLAANVWTNPGETPGNGIDDDLDGHIDDVHGWDFGDGDADPDPVPVIDPEVGIDEGWHGTFVAGLAAAMTDNATGIAGVAWHCRIMPLKVTTSDGDIPISAIAGAFSYAIAHGARVINLSLGTADSAAASVFQPLVNAAVAADIVVVAAAGNDGTDQPHWPASCDSVLAVASTNASNVRSDFSNWGPYVDLCAPGESMWSTIASNYEYDEYSQIFFEYLWYWDGVTPYMYNDGTSFSAPVVSAAAALVRSISPVMTAKQVAQALIVSGDVKVYDNPIGPKVNLDRALVTIADVAGGPAPPPGLRLEPAPNPAFTAMSVRFTLPAPGRARIAIHDAAGRLVRTLADGTFAAGERSLAWDLTDARGARAAAGLYFVRVEAGAASMTRRIAVVR